MAYVYGESWCRRTEKVDEEVPEEFFNEWFTLRRKQLEIGCNHCDHITVHVDTRPIPEERKEEWEKISDQLEEMCDNVGIEWEISSPMRELSIQDIDNWFKDKEFAACGEESGVGVSIASKKRAALLYFSVSNEFDIDLTEEKPKKEKPIVVDDISVNKRAVDPHGD